MGDSLYFELADNEIFQQLEDTSKGDFYIWNGTSLGNLFVAASVYNGTNAAVNGKLELTLLKGRQRFDTVSTSNLKV